MHLGSLLSVSVFLINEEGKEGGERESNAPLETEYE